MNTRRLSLGAAAAFALGSALACGDSANLTGPSQSPVPALRATAQGSTAAALSKPASKSNGQFNEKFTFNPVTYPDGTTGVIEAGSKRSKQSQFTVCDYSTDGYRESLGQFGSNTFSSQDPDDVLKFCLDHFGERS